MLYPSILWRHRTDPLCGETVPIHSVYPSTLWRHYQTNSVNELFTITHHRGCYTVGVRGCYRHTSVLLASERSERDTYKVTQSKIGDVCLFIYLYICLDVCMSFCTLTLRIFVFARRSTPSQTSLNRILWFCDHYPYHLRN